jgi:hypothetical protein
MYYVKIINKKMSILDTDNDETLDWWKDFFDEDNNLINDPVYESNAKKQEYEEMYERAMKHIF